MQRSKTTQKKKRGELEAVLTLALLASWASSGMNEDVGEEEEGAVVTAVGER
jgi:hypothetical protein